MVNRGQIVEYIVNNYFGKSIEKASAITAIKKRDFEAWIEGRRKPNRDTIDYLMHCAFVPSFKIVAEYAPFDHTQAARTQIRAAMGNYADRPGIYAFYDSLGRLLYVGKAGKLAGEICLALDRDVHIKLPTGVRRPDTRGEIVSYVSAYDVGDSVWEDLPKIVEALILRISKPLLNKNSGNIPKVSPPEKLDD